MSNQGWFDVFSLMTYAAMGLCTYGAVKKGFRHHKRNSAWARGYGIVGQPFILLLFCAAMWLVESYAHYRTPYYFYAFHSNATAGFRDLLPRAPNSVFAALGVGKPSTTPCSDYVSALPSLYGRIPLTVVLFEAVLAYSAMWTARLMGGRVWTRPLLAGLVLVNVDLMLDPVVAVAHLSTHAQLFDGSNQPVLPPETRDTISNAGIGFWHWYLPPDFFAQWFGIPAFNFVAWWAAPVMLVSLVSFAVEGVIPIIEKWFGVYIDEKRPPFSATWDLLAYVVFVAGSVALLLGVSPSNNPSTSLQVVITVGVLVISLGAFASQFRTYKTQSRVDSTLTIPLSAGLLVPAVAGIFEGQALRVPSLMVVIPISLGMGLWLAFLPYRGALDQFAKRLRDLDRFVRLHYFGFTAMMVLFGAALAFPRPAVTVAPILIAGLVGVAACFHVFAYVLNDLIDLPLDKTVARRLRDPLAGGRMSEETAAGIIGSTLSGAVASMLFVTEFQLKAGGYAALAGAFLLMTVYNGWGKKIAWPPVTDAIEGASWGLLGFFGMFAAGAQDPAAFNATWKENEYAAFALFSCAFLFIFIINGIHGGLRDAKTDQRLKKNTTALWLGATPNPDGSVRSTLKIQIFAFTFQTLLFGILFWFIVVDPPVPDASRWLLPKYAVFLGLGLLFVANSYALFEVVRTECRQRNTWISWHLLLLLLPGLFVFMVNGCPAGVFKVSVGILFFCRFSFKKKSSKRSSPSPTVRDPTHRNPLGCSGANPRGVRR